MYSIPGFAYMYMHVNYKVIMIHYELNVASKQLPTAVLQINYNDQPGLPY